MLSRANHGHITRPAWYAVREGGLVTAAGDEIDETPHGRHDKEGGSLLDPGSLSPNHALSSMFLQKYQSFLIFVWSRYRALSMQSCVKKKRTGTAFVY